MAKAKTKIKAKVPVKKAARVTHTKKEYDPTESMIIQAGIIFIMVSAIGVFGYVVNVYGVFN